MRLVLKFATHYFDPDDNLQARIGRLCRCKTLGLMYMRKVTTPITTQMIFTV